MRRWSKKVLFFMIRIQTVHAEVVNTLDSGKDVGQTINVGLGKFVKKNKCVGLH